MKIANCLTSSCRYCRYYKTEGRRGGMCQQLGVLVQARWKSCNLSCPTFTDYNNQGEIALLEKSFSLGCATPKNASVSETSKNMPTFCSIEKVIDKVNVQQDNCV